MTYLDLAKNAQEIPLFDPEVRLVDLPHPIYWSDLFGNGHPVHLEVGSGSGHWTAECALRRPGWNLFAVEKTTREVRRAKDKILRRGLKNVRFVRCDVLYFIRQFIAHDTIDGIHVYFPDPWPKRRHAKRRVIRPEIVMEFARVLKPDGLLHIKTDVASYQEQILRILNATTRLDLVESRRLEQENLSEDLEKTSSHISSQWTEIFSLTTNYERKARIKGHPIYYTRWRFCDTFPKDQFQSNDSQKT